MNLRRLFSRTAFIISICYAAVALGVAIYFWRMAEPEASGFAFAIFGFPWSILAILTNRFSLSDKYCLLLVVSLNTGTVYFFAFAMARLFRDDSK